MGEFFVYIETVHEKYYFLSLPDLIIRTVSLEDFDFAVNNKVLDYIEKIPADVFKQCEAQYNKITK